MLKFKITQLYPYCTILLVFFRNRQWFLRLKSNLEGPLAYFGIFLSNVQNPKSTPFLTCNQGTKSLSFISKFNRHSTRQPRTTHSVGHDVLHPVALCCSSHPILSPILVAHLDHSPSSVAHSITLIPDDSHAFCVDGVFRLWHVNLITMSSEDLD